MAKASAKKQGTPIWADCATTDLKAAEGFYAETFGWVAECVTASDGVIYSIQRLDGKMVAGIYELNEELRSMNVPPHWDTYIEVDDFAATLKRVSEEGGTVIRGATVEPEVGTFVTLLPAPGPGRS